MTYRHGYHSILRPRTFSGVVAPLDPSNRIILIATDPFSASANLSFTISEDLVGGVEKKFEAILGVSPNPVNSALTINMTEEVRRISILPLQGGMMHTVTYPSFEIEVNMATWTPVFIC